MSERFSTLFRLEDNLHNTGAPVIVAAGVLLKDNQTGKVLAQLKFQNVGRKLVKGVKVRIFPADETGEALPAAEHAYSDLVADRGREFGQKEPIILPDAAARSFSLAVTEVCYTDDSVWTGDGSLCVPLEGAKPLEERLGGRQELLEVCRLHFGQDTKALYTVEGGLWTCPCGAVNLADEENCHRCGRKAADLAGFTREELEKEGAEVKARTEAEQRRARAERERREAEEKVLKAQKLERNHRMLFIAIIVLVIVGAVAFFMHSRSVKAEQYQQAMDYLDEGMMDEAERLLRDLGGYQDSREIVDNIELETAWHLCENREYDALGALLDELLQGEDAEKSQRAKELLPELQALARKNEYAYAEAREQEEAWLEAYSSYRFCGDYQDAEKKAIQMKLMAVILFRKEDAEGFRYREDLELLEEDLGSFRSLDGEALNSVIPGLWLERDKDYGWAAMRYETDGTCHEPHTDRGQHWTVQGDSLLCMPGGEDIFPLKPWTTAYQEQFLAEKWPRWTGGETYATCEADEGVYVDVGFKPDKDGGEPESRIVRLRIAPDSPYAEYAVEVTFLPPDVSTLAELVERYGNAPEAGAVQTAPAEQE